MTTSKCSTCQAPIVWLRTAGLGKRMAVEPTSVAPGASVYLPGLHRLHTCAATAPQPTKQRSLFGDEE